MPKLISQGTFALYETDKGGIHITMQLEGETEPRHFDAPPMMVKLMGKKFFGPSAVGNDIAPVVRDVITNGIVDESDVNHFEAYDE